MWRQQAKNTFNMKHIHIGLSHILEMSITGDMPVKGHDKKLVHLRALEFALEWANVKLVTFADSWVKTDISSVHRGEELPEGGLGIDLTSGDVLWRHITDRGWWEFEWLPTGRKLPRVAVSQIINAGRAEASRKLREEIALKNGVGVYLPNIRSAFIRGAVHKFKQFV